MPRRVAPPQWCIYCGQLATGKDHVIPWSWRSNERRRGAASQAPGLRVPCCRDCNLILGATPIFSVKERQRFVAARLAQKLAKSTKAEWSDEQLAALGRGLLFRKVSGDIAARDLLKRRLAYANKVSAEKDVLTGDSSE